MASTLPHDGRNWTESLRLLSYKCAVNITPITSDIHNGGVMSSAQSGMLG